MHCSKANALVLDFCKLFTFQRFPSQFVSSSIKICPAFVYRVYSEYVTSVGRACVKVSVADDSVGRRRLQYNC